MDADIDSQREEEVDEGDDLSFVESLNIRLGKEYCKDDEKENLETHLKADDAFVGNDATEKKRRTA